MRQFACGLPCSWRWGPPAPARRPRHGRTAARRARRGPPARVYSGTGDRRHHGARRHTGSAGTTGTAVPLGPPAPRGPRHHGDRRHHRNGRMATHLRSRQPRARHRDRRRRDVRVQRGRQQRRRAGADGAGDSARAGRRLAAGVPGQDGRNGPRRHAGRRRPAGRLVRPARLRRAGHLRRRDRRCDADWPAGAGFDGQPQLRRHQPPLRAGANYPTAAPATTCTWCASTAPPRRGRPS